MYKFSEEYKAGAFGSDKFWNNSREWPHRIVVDNGYNNLLQFHIRLHG